MSSAFLTLYRSLTRHRLYAILNIGGLALGIAVFLVLMLFVRFETNYDRVLPGWERVWTIERTIQFPGNPEVQIPSSPTLSGQLAAAFPDLVAARMTSYDTATVLTGNTSTTRKLALVDHDYFRIFPFPVIEGNTASTLARPDGIVVTQSVAEAYFGRTSALGRTLAVAIDGKARVYRVGAVIADLPKNQTYASVLFAAIPAELTDDSRSTSNGVVTFLALPDAAADRIGAFMRRHPDPGFNPEARQFLKEGIVPLSGRHLAGQGVGTVVAVLGGVGIVALLLAVVNYVNLATARAGLRAREIAMRKVVGATRRMLIGQLLGEALAAVTLAALIGLALAEIALPFVNAIGGTDLSIAYWGAGSILPPLVAMTVLVTLLAGFYPAFVISRFQAAGVLAAARTPGGDRAGARLRKALVVTQFGIAVALMIGTAVLFAQTRHVQQADIGFGRDGLIMMSGYGDPALDPGQRARLVDAMRQTRGVAGITTSGVVPGGGTFAIAKMKRAGATGEPPMIVQATVGEHFFDTYRARLLAGRVFDPDRFALDIGNGDTGRKALAGRVANIMLNRTAARRLGFTRADEAIGQIVSLDSGTVRIVGVIADMRFGSPRDPVEAFAYSYRPGGGYGAIVVIRTSVDPTVVLERLETAWRRVAPAVPPAATTVDQKLYESFYRQDVQRSRLFSTGAVLAVAIGCLGLYGLAAFDTMRRVKEIGIRKVLGASTSVVMRLLLVQFLKPVLLANVIAWPIAWFAMSHWLSGFDDRIPLSPVYFVAASALALAIAAATVASQAWRVARAEPARALRQF
ncbi:ABC transporter permease [Sphingomonas faeni]|uniref:ABC transporter permease n=1 Tax=Sphingomonas faeni TaxID=185950 RepID=UPI00334DB01A